MNKNTAEGILESLAWMGFPLDMLVKRIQDEPDESERKRLLEYLKPIVVAQTDLMFFLAKEYPDLDPIGDGEERYYQYKLKYQTNEFPAKRMSAEDIESAERAGLEAAEEIRQEMKDE